MPPELPTVGNIIESTLSDRIFKVVKVDKDDSNSMLGSVYHCVTMDERKQFEIIPEIAIRAYWRIIGKE